MLVAVDLKVLRESQATAVAIVFRQISHMSNGGRMSIGRRVRLAVASIAFLVIAALAPVLDMEPHLRVIAGAVAALLGLAIAVAYFAGSWVSYTRDDLGEQPSRFALEFADLAPRVDYYARQLSPLQIAQYLQLLADPAQHVQRITESVRPLTRSVDVTTTFTVRLAGEPGDHVVVPVLVKRRGSIEDGLRFQDSEGRRVSSLTQSETIAYTMAAIRNSVKSRGLKALEAYRFVETDVFNILESQEVTSGSNVKSTIRRIRKIVRDKRLVKAISKPLRRHAAHFHICVRVTIPTDAAQNELNGSKGSGVVFHTARLTVRARKILQYNFHKNMRGFGERRIIDLFRLAFGIRASVISWPLVNASRATSFHLDVAGPPDTYLARQVLSDAKGQDVSANGNIIAQPRLGQRHAHLHTRGGAGLGALTYTLHYFERMPGSMATAAASAVSVAALTWIGLIALISVPASTSLSSWDYAALILAFPAAISLWLGIDQRNELMRGVAAARMSTVLTICIALVVAAASMIVHNDEFGHRAWLTLGLISTINACIAICSWIMRARLQSHFVNRPAASL